MAMENFQITELLDCVVENPTTGGFVGTIDYIDDINIENGSTKKELRGGVGNAILYSMSSEFSSTLSGNAIMSTDLFKILTSTTPTSGTQKFTESEIITASGTNVTLSQTPSSGGKIYVFPLDSDGKRMAALNVGSPASNATDYSITGKVITANSALSGKKFKVIYEYDKSGTKFEKQAKDSDTYRLVARAKAVDLATKAKKSGQFIIEAWKPEVNFSIGASNADFTKASISSECLLDTVTKTNWYFIAED